MEFFPNGFDEMTRALLAPVFIISTFHSSHLGVCAQACDAGSA
ncbi:hypothetical protein NU688_01970 [Variovorax sp. ZS18.2.2]|nr:hypothetical protein [Variovorax sp. ZS18.2.2]MCR6474909.1 hypothetical protein [Variovorax sp. ZS18.2.2]